MKLVFLSICILQLVFAIPVRKHGPVPNSPENIAIIESGNYAQNIEELSGQFEGDMVLSIAQERMLKGLDRTGFIDPALRWPNNTVPYILHDVFNQEQKDYIELGMREIERVSCVTFVPRTTEESYVAVEGNGTGCFSDIGYGDEGEQSVHLQLFPPGQGCFRLGTIVHEFLHALGFFHMQSATERDDFVTIMWDHIQEDTKNNFESHSADLITNFGVEYDVGSVMHYSAWAFTKDGFATIVPHDISSINVLGQRIGMSDKDIMRLNAMYC